MNMPAPELDQRDEARGSSLFVVGAEAGLREIAGAAAAGGWRLVAAERPDRAATGFLDSGARLALVAMHDGFDEGLSVLRALAGATETTGSALLALVGGEARTRLDEVLAAGATHYLAVPLAAGELVQALRFADRHAERLAGRSSERRQARPGRLGRRDAGTGLADAHAARRWIAEADAATPAAISPCALLLVGAERFDMINAAYGRTVGDELLLAAARRIERVAAAPDRLIARLSGAELLVGLPAPIDEAALRQLADRIGDTLHRPFAVGGQIVSVAYQVAVVTPGAGERTPDALLRHASRALAALRDGDDDAEPGPRLAIDLPRAIADDEIELLFQPQVAVIGGAIVGVEALARWRHPELGELGAEALLAAAARAGQLRPLSALIQRKALDAAASWSGRCAALRLSINVTAEDVATPGFADWLFDAVDAAGLRRTRLTVELTETGLVEDLAHAAALLARLRASGLRTAIDDFGTGYSSLAYLKALPLDYLKLDARLSQDIAGTSRDRVVVRGVIEMARSLGLAVIAEGVETEQQLALLAAEGCGYYQGFLRAPPLTEAALAELVEGCGG